jgi:hypothetical protein
MKLPPEIRLKIYDFVFSVPHEYMNLPLVTIKNSARGFSTRGMYRRSPMRPYWVGQDGKFLPLLLLSSQVSREAEQFLFSRSTIFFAHSFSPAHVVNLFDTMGSTARHETRCVGFEVYFYVYTLCNGPKHSFSEYKQACRGLQAKLPKWQTVVIYLNPEGLCPAACDTSPANAAQGIRELENIFKEVHKNVIFYPTDVAIALQARQ